MRHVSKFTILLVSASLLAGCGGGGLFKKKAEDTRSSASASPCWSTRRTSRSIRRPRRCRCRLPPRRCQRQTGPSRAAMPASRSGHVALGNALGVAWTASIGEGSSNKGAARRRAGRRRRPGLHHRHAGHGPRVRRAQRRPGLVGALRRHRRATAARSMAAASPMTTAGSMRPTASAMSRRSTPPPARAVWTVSRAARCAARRRSPTTPSM